MGCSGCGFGNRGFSHPCDSQLPHGEQECCQKALPELEKLREEPWDVPAHSGISEQHLPLPLLSPPAPSLTESSAFSWDCSSFSRLKLRESQPSEGKTRLKPSTPIPAPRRDGYPGKRNRTQGKKITRKSRFLGSGLFLPRGVPQHSRKF